VKITSAQIITQIKTWILPIIIFLLSLFLAQEMMIYFKDFNFSTISLLSLPKIAGIMLCLSFVIALSMPAWEGGKFLLIVPLPMSLGIYLNLLVLEPLNALIVCGLIFLILAIHIDKSIKLERLLIKNIPHISLRPAIKGYLFAISLSAFFIVLLNPQGHDITIGRVVSSTVMAPIQGFLGEGIDTINTVEQRALEQKMEKEVTEGVKRAIEPYRHLFNIVMAIVVFVGMQGLNALIYLIYSNLITPFFWIIRKIGFFHSDLEVVQKEHLHF